MPVLDKFPFIKRGNSKKAQLGLLLEEISVRLKDQQMKLDEAMRRLKDRDKELFDRVVRSQMESDVAKAAIYAEEISDIRKMLKIIYTASLAIEKVRLKLETVQELQGLSLVLLPVLKILGGLKEQVKGIAPDVAVALDSITSSVNSIAVETGILNEKAVVPAIVDEQAKKILDEAQKMAENKLKESLPALPQPPSEPPKVKTSTKKFGEEDLLNYVSRTNGFIDVEHVSKIYGVDKEEVMELLRLLARKGVIVLEE
ncbi:cell division protein [Sulfodiicoccus acidiphilus]|uniref:Cell division protein n=1 Tax=Sulfodiicoccus acidiphilus TaxID=1670455 RepID=A0A348B3H9_9CREN|nr:cell division protein CdvB [Sulfodiicoccus acidiphilus]BBD72731.1 cell division protein [Sulfodiicoccus acidiphilus]GGT95232.1 cell division protein [Sulfodiicoccus acidiphilus]